MIVVRSNMLAGKVVAVTGAGRSIGRQIALLCAREGAAVVVNDFGGTLSGEGLDAGPAAAVVAEIIAAGGQARAKRKNEIFRFSPPRPVRAVHREQGWTTASIAAELLPALKPSFFPLQVSSDLFGWDPV